MPSWRERRRLGVLGAAGVVLTHCLAYYLSVDDMPHHGAMHHVSGGHGFWPVAVSAAVLLAIVTIGSSAISPPPERPGTPGLFARLATVQCTTWVALLAAERILTGAGLEVLAGEPVLWIGLGLQLLAAYVGALLFRVAATLARALRTRGGDFVPSSSDTSPSLERCAGPPHLHLGAGGLTVRGPPAPALVP